MLDTTLARSIIGLGLAAAIFGCPQQPEPPNNKPAPLLPLTTESALTTANDNVRRHTIGMARAGGFLQSSDFFGDLLNGTDSRAPCPEGQECPEPLEPATLEEQADEMADEIALRIFNETNVEIVEEKKIVLLLKASAICANTTTDPEGNKQEIIDEECAARLEVTPIRIELTSRRVGDVDIALRVGTTARPIQLSLYADRIALQVDLGDAKEAAIAFSTIVGEALEVPEGEISGTIRFELIANAELDYTASVSVVAPVRVSSRIDGEEIRIDLGISAPLAAIRFDGRNQTVTTESKAGALDLRLPLGQLGGEETCTIDENGELICRQEDPIFDGIVDVHVPASSGSAVLDGSDTVRMSFGYQGAMTVSIDGIEIYRLDLNAQNGRRFDAELSGSDDGFVIAVRPLLDVVMDFDFSSLIDRMEVPPQLASDSIRVRLDSAEQPAIRLLTTFDAEPAPSRPGDAPAPRPSIEPVLEVLRGRFAISSRAEGTEIAVDAGQCLLVKSLEEGSEPTLLGQLAAGACE